MALEAGLAVAASWWRLLVSLLVFSASLSSAQAAEGVGVLPMRAAGIAGLAGPDDPVEAFTEPKLLWNIRSIRVRDKEPLVKRSELDFMVVRLSW